MKAQNRHSIIECVQEQSSFTVFQPSFFSSSFEPESLEDFDFESSPMSNTNNTPTIHEEEDEPIPHSSGVTSNSNVTSFASTAPIFQDSQRQKQEIEEEYHLTAIKKSDDSQETLKSKDNIDQPPSNFVLRDRPYRNYQIFPGHTRFLLGGRLVTSRDYRAFIAGLLLLITPSILFAIFT